MFNKILVAALLSLLSTGLWASPELKRTISQVGAGLGLSGASMTSPGVAVSGAILTFIDPTTAEGPYYGLFTGGILVVTAEGSVTDTKLVEFGWRPRLFGSDVRLDLNLAPTVGARYDHSQIAGSAYTGLEGGWGLFFPWMPNVDLGVSMEAGVNLFTWGATRTENLNYGGFLVTLAYKSLTQTETLPW